MGFAERSSPQHVSKPPRKCWAVILAGGDGRRLGDLTIDADGVCRPKQYCSLNGGPSLLHLSLHRALRLVPPERVVLVVTEAHRRWWEPELSSLRRPTVVVQPSNRGTGLGVLLPLLVIAKSDPEADVICIPSDHYVKREAVLAEVLRQVTAPDMPDSDRLTLLGIAPNAPDSGFGYLCPAPDSGVGMRPVDRFVERPDGLAAADLIRAGGVWDSGIIAGRISQIVSLYRRHLPGMMLELKATVECWSDPRIPSADLASLYSRHPALDFSRDVLYRHPESLQFLTVPPCGWTDVDTPVRLAGTLYLLRSLCHDAPSDSMRAFNLATALARTGFGERKDHTPAVRAR
jgi:mannose-1-phosphate guanylyltransferase